MTSHLLGDHVAECLGKSRSHLLDSFATSLGLGLFDSESSLALLSDTSAEHGASHVGELLALLLADGLLKVVELTFILGTKLLDLLGSHVTGHLQALLQIGSLQSEDLVFASVHLRIELLLLLLHGIVEAGLHVGNLAFVLSDDLHPGALEVLILGLLDFGHLFLGSDVDASDELVTDLLDDFVVRHLVDGLLKLASLLISLLRNETLLLVTEFLFLGLTNLLLALIAITLLLLLAELDLKIALRSNHLQFVSKVTIGHAGIDCGLLVAVVLHLNLAGSDHVLHSKLVLHATKVFGQVRELL